MSRSLIFVCTLGMVAAAVAASWPAGAAAKPEVRDFVFFAVMEGLYVDGVQNDMVDRVLLKEEGGATNRVYMHFVYACPLCMPAINAFRVYRERRMFYGWKGVTDTFGDGLGKPLRAQLGSDDSKQRLAAIHALIQRWVDRRLGSMNLDGTQRAAWRAALADARKEGMRMLKTYRAAGDPGIFEEGCAVCDGAVEASEDR